MFRRVVTFFVLLPVYGYRYGVSPLLGPRCRFQPTCSEYAVDAVKAHGPWVGFWLSAKRILSCHPFERLGARHGFDPVPVAISRAAWYAPWRMKPADEKAQPKC